ncbi:RNHCP domain-containing protein [Candidatus Peregrinibacteria bacterium]|nr:RNHCP domain-containing protein [Candidatus Peregrinibacteria bacterium]
MGFIVHKEGFLCVYCGADNPPAPKTCRNHCRTCLCSEHLDDTFPGDRASSCHGKMIPTSAEHDSKRNWMLVHSCEKCGKVVRNKVAEDDDLQMMAKIQAEKHEIQN